MEAHATDGAHPLSVRSSTALHPIIIDCSDASAIVQLLTCEGYEANLIDATTVTTLVPASYIATLASQPQVHYLNGTRTVHPATHTARVISGVDQLHKGAYMNTPFTGKGVVIGIIDQGFDYNHIAFLDADGNSRVCSVWDHNGHKNPTANPTGEGDGIIGTDGHATHVTCIAAGSRIPENKYYGMAPDADIIMIPSNFYDASILAEAKHIRDYANKQGKPFVINMSFGMQTGPHDGTDKYSQSMDGISADGGILVAAMGNEGGMAIHTSHTFTQAQEKVYVIIEFKDQDNSLIDLWEQTGDKKKHLKVRPFIYDISTGKHDFKNDRYWGSQGLPYASIDPYNHKEHFEIDIKKRGITGTQRLGLEIEGNPGDHFHLWNEPGYSSIYTVTRTMGKTYLQGDDKYCVGEGAATIPSAIAVASYNSNDGKFHSVIKNTTLSYTNWLGAKGDISSFSSIGPGLGDTPKPTVSAPGGNIQSAFGQYRSDFDPKDKIITDIVERNGKTYYYATMNGTSMASPVVSGIIALWLEANPKLTYTEVKQIIAETSKHDSFTRTDQEWNATWGYGKINAYAGLKRALEMAEASDVNDLIDTTTPLTTLQEGRTLRVLFNNDESYAHITLYNARGTALMQQHYSNPCRGEETVIDMHNLPAGMYVVQLQTTANTTTQKVCVQ